MATQNIKNVSFIYILHYHSFALSLSSMNTTMKTKVFLHLIIYIWFATLPRFTFAVVRHDTHSLVTGRIPSLTPDMIVEHYSKSEGLPSNTVYCSLKDNDGFMWFGTWHGLTSFDGAKFSALITRQNRFSDIPPRKVRSIVEDKDGHLWIRNTDNHLFLFDKATETFHDIYNELKHLSGNVQVIKIQLMPNGKLLILTRNKNLYEISASKNSKINIKRIYSSQQDIDPTTMQLKRNVVGETSEYVYWLNTTLNVCVVPKKSSQPLLKNFQRNKQLSCFNYNGNNIYIGTNKGTIFVINTSSHNTSTYTFNNVNAPISSISNNGEKFFFTTSSGLYSFTKSTNPKLLTAQAQRITTSFTDTHNKLWLNSADHYLICYNTTTNASQTFSVPSDSLFAEIKFKDTDANGLFILLRNGEVWRFNHEEGMMQNVNNKPEFRGYNNEEPHFFDLNIDSRGTLWLSSTNKGVYKVSFPRHNFKFLLQNIIPSGNGNDNNGVRALYQVHNGDLWIGTRHGDLYCIDSKSHTVKQHFSKEEVGIVYHIMEDRQGNLWFSTKGAGLVMATPDKTQPKGLRLTRYKNNKDNKNSISSNRVYYTYQDSHNRIWVCTFYGGLNLIERSNGKTIFKNKRNGFTHYPSYGLYTDVRSMTEDNNGRIWIATTDGLMSFTSNFNKAENIKFETYREQNTSDLACNDIFTMFKDHNGNVWLGIFGSGLNRIESYNKHNHRPVLKEYKMSEQQGSNVVTSIAEDKSHCLWICTENGVGSLEEGTAFVKSYGRFAGFPDISIEDNTSICLNNGYILIGSQQGLLSFNPSEVITENENALKTFITEFKVDNRPVWNFDPPIYEGSLKYADKIRLKHNQASFTIEFSSPCYADNNLIPYKYILDGYEKEWHTSSTSRIASYVNVPPGHYKFRVKAEGSNSTERTLEVVISPPWWASWWAYAFYALLILLFVYGAVRLVIYMIRMRNEIYINNRLAELKIRFFTNVSHELRTPLSLIKGPIEELKETENLSDRGKEYLGLIDRNAHKMLRLVNQILDFRKIQNGKMKMHVSYVDINGMIEMLMQEFRLIADERDIVFIFEKPQDRVMMWCDAEKIGIVLNNLLNNAFKYTSNGGKICIALECDFDHRICTIRIEDDGESIPKSQLELIFERFSQANNKTADDSVFSGSGIGLSLSKEYVNMHHGRIWAENIREGKGVVFSVELPTDKEHFEKNNIEIYIDDNTAENNAQAEDDNDHENATIHENKTEEDRPTLLLIEDNADMRSMLKLQLSDKYHAITARDGTEGLYKINHFHPDIIITDLLMPGIDGMEVLRNVRHDFSISHIPIIVLTSKNTEEDKMEAIKTGANAFITKPFSSTYLIARIEQLLEEQRIFQRKMIVQTTVESSSDSNKDEYEQHLVKKDIEFMRQIHDIIERNLNANDFNIDAIASTIGLSRSAFFKKLKSLTGFAPVDFVKEIRLNKAVKLIETTDYNMADIAYSVGFRDAGYFGKCFRKKYGKTPKEYRNEIRK